MLRFIVIAGALVATAVTAAPAKPKKPAFEFRDWHARDAYMDGDPRLKQCTAIPAGTACVFADDKIAGVAARQIGAAFGGQGLFALEAKFASEDASTIETALRERYGKPCEQRIEKPFNVFGHKFERKIRVWCFAEGKATFQSMTDKASEGAFEFATHDAPKQAAVQDF